MRVITVIICIVLSSLITTCTKSVEIDSQKWMKNNLNVTTFRNGDQIQEAKTIVEWQLAAKEHEPAWCHYDFNPTLGKVFGKLYNWYAVIDSRKISPRGWHIPSDDEWKDLEMALGMNDSEVNRVSFRGENTGGKMKTKTSSLWLSRSNTMFLAIGWRKPNIGATNDSKFSAKPAGIKSMIEFDQLEESAYFWSSSEYDNNSAWARELTYNLSGINRCSIAKYKGLSIRCVKD